MIIYASLEHCVITLYFWVDLQSSSVCSMPHVYKCVLNGHADTHAVCVAVWIQL